MGFSKGTVNRFKSALSAPAYGAILLDGTYVFDPEHEFRSHVEPHQVADTPVVNLANAVVTATLEGNEIRVALKCDPISFGTFVLDGAAGIAIFRATGAPSEELVAVAMFDAIESSSSAAPITYEPSPDGLVTLSLF